jgi:hypothetical protein
MGIIAQYFRNEYNMIEVNRNIIQAVIVCSPILTELGIIFFGGFLLLTGGGYGL